MIVGKHGVIRAAEVDDVATMKRIYDPERPLGCLLDQKREYVLFTSDELRELLGGGTGAQGGAFQALEGLDGVVRGFCALRSGAQEQQFGQYAVMLFDEQDYAGDFADEVGAYLVREAFERRQINKVVAHCLDSEKGLRAMLLRHGFRSDGMQREVLYTLGRWFDLESLTLFRRDTPYGQDGGSASGGIEE